MADDMDAPTHFRLEEPSEWEGGEWTDKVEKASVGVHSMCRLTRRRGLVLS